MRRHLWLGVGLVLLTAGANRLGAADATEDSAKEVKAQLQMLNEAFKKGDVEALRRLLADEHVAITAYYGRPMTKAEQIKSLPDFKNTEYTADDMKVTMVTKDVGLVTYRLTQKGTFGGKEVTPKAYACAVWVNRGGKWQEITYQETPLDGK
jgi:hypothetical protein